MTRYATSTVTLATMIEDKFLRLGTGDLNIKVDDIVIEYYRTGLAVSLGEADIHVRKHLKTTWRYLWKECDWHSVPVTQFFFDKFVHGSRVLWDDDTTEVEIKRSIAGLGRGQRFVGLHFFVGEDDPLFAWHTAHNSRGGVGKEMATLERVIDVAETNKLTPGALTAIASRATSGTRGVQDHIKTIRRIAASGEG